MRHLIVLIICALTIVLGLANLAFARSGSTLSTGQALADAGDIKGAMRVFAALTRVQTESAEAHARLGGMQLLDRRYADAVRSFQRAVSLGDNGTRSFLGMGMAYLHMGQMGAARAAFVEARARGTRQPAQVDEVIAWIDARDGVPAVPQR